MANWLLIGSYTALWALMLMLLAAVFVLYRYIGQQLTDSPEGRMAQGPDVGDRLPTARIRDVDGRAVELGGSGRPTFMLFVSTACEPCMDLLPAFGSFVETHGAGMQNVLIARSSTIERVEELARGFESGVQVVADNNWKLGGKLKISATPFAVIADSNAVVRAKGMPNTYEYLEWFAEQLEVASGRRDESIEIVSQFAD